MAQATGSIPVRASKTLAAIAKFVMMFKTVDSKQVGKKTRSVVSPQRVCMISSNVWAFGHLLLTWAFSKGKVSASLTAPCFNGRNDLFLI